MQPVRSLSSASWPEPGSVTTVECGSCARVARAFSIGVRRSRRPPSSSAGTSGSGPVNGAGDGVARPLHAVVDVARAQHGLPVERGVARRAGSPRAPPARSPGDRRAGSSPAGRAAPTSGSPWSRSARTDRSAGAGLAALADAPQAHEQRGVAAARGAIAAGSAACRNGLRSPAMSRNESSSGVAYAVARRARRVEVRPRSGPPLLMRVTSAATSATGSLVASRQAAFAHCSRSTRGRLR